MMIATAAAIGIRLIFFKQSVYLASHGQSIARTFTTLKVRSAVWVVTDQLTSRFRTVWLVAFPAAFELIAHHLAFRLSCLATSDTFRLLTYGIAISTVITCAGFFRAFNDTARLCTANVTDRREGRCAGCMA